MQISELDKNEKATINSINKKCFQYAETLKLNHEDFGKMQKE